MEFKPIQKRKRIYQTIIQQIKDSIASGAIEPGDKLPSERAMADMLGVSRTSVKEAVTVLDSSGIITVKPGVGMFINEDTKQNLLYRFSRLMNEEKTEFYDLLELRQAIEGDAAYYAAERITLPEKTRLTEIYNELSEAIEDGRIALEEDLSFHFCILEISDNPIMLDIMNLVSEKIRTNLKDSREHSVKDKQLNRSVLEEHKHIYHAIIEQKPDEAKQAMWEHHQHIKQRYKERQIAKMEVEL